MTTRERCNAARRRRVERAREAGKLFWDMITAAADRVDIGAPFPVHDGFRSKSATARLRRNAVVVPAASEPPAKRGRTWRRSSTPGPERDYLARLLSDCRAARKAPEYLFEELCARLGKRAELTEQLRGITASLAVSHGPMAAARCTLELIDLAITPVPHECRTDDAP